MGVSDAKPGDRFTDPDGGTWVRLAWISTLPTGRVQAPCEWAQITADGTYYPRSQEEAEAAGLVAVVAATEVPNHPPGWYHVLLPDWASKWFYFPPAEKGAVHTAWDGSRWEFDMLGGGVWDLSHYAPGSDGDRTVPAAPAPLDPGNPEHVAWGFRQAAIALDPELHAGAINDLCRWADEQDRKAGEVEDRERAEEIARTEWVKAHEGFFGGMPSPKWECLSREGRELYTGIALAAIRAERNRSEEIE